MSQRRRLTLLAATRGSTVATIDGSTVDVALPVIECNLGGLAGRQWVANAGGRLVGAPQASPQQA